MKTKPKPKSKAPTTSAAARAICIAAFRAQPDAKYAWCIHHGSLVELISNNYAMGIRARIDFIATDKAKREKAARYNNMRPVKETPTFRRAIAYEERHYPRARPTKTLLALYRKQVPFGTWSHGSIF